MRRSTQRTDTTRRLTSSFDRRVDLDRFPVGTRVDSITEVDDDNRSTAELVGVSYFGRAPVRVTNPIAVVTEDAVVTGHVYDVGTTTATTANGA